MQILKDSLKTIALSLSMLFFVGVAYAWTEPTDTPPNPSGGSSPLNTSSTFQDKVGDLWVNSLGLTNGLIATGGSVGIGTANPGTRLEVQAPTSGTFNTAFRGRSNDGAKHIDLNIQNDGNANFGGNFTNFGIGTINPGARLEVQAPTSGTLNTAFRGRSNNGLKHIDLNIQNDGKANFGGDFYGFGIGTTDPQAELEVNGTMMALNFSNLSDLRWKKNIKPLENSLSKLSSLQGVDYEWKKEEYPDMNFNDRTQIGFIAQDVEKIIPEVVTTADNGYKSVSYEKLVPVLTEAIKDQQKQIEELKIAIEQLKSGK